VIFMEGPNLHMTVTVTEFQRDLLLTAFRQRNLAFIAMSK